MSIHRALSSVLLLGKLLARAQSWAPPSWVRRPLLGRTRTTATTSLQQSSSLSIDPPEILPLDTSGGTQIIADNEVFLRPDRDPRHYRMIRLANNLQVLLVSDNLSIDGVGVEAGAVHVQAGHFDDTVPGLAHFHEHLLFLGTEKYPEEDAYETFLSSNGGYSNAYTDMEDTNYYFAVTTDNQSRDETSEALRGALDRLAQFFIAPRFDPDAVDREINAIDSEYRNGRTSDNWRSFQLLKSLCNPQHPFAKFGCGNNETLLAPPREELLAELHRFWENYYRTYNMRLTVVGHASLDALQRTVEETFGQIPYSQGDHRRIKSIEGQPFVREGAVYKIKAFTPDLLGAWHQVVPLTETRSIKVHFAIPPLDDPLIQKSRPHRLLSHLLGHESPGSLHALLNEEGYVRSLSSGVSIDTSDFGLFAVSLTLTPKGMQNKQKVLDLLFQWIAIVRQNQSNLKGYQDELKAMSSMNFRFREIGDPVDFCSSAAELQFDSSISPERFLHGNDLDTADFDELLTKTFFERLRPENAIIVETNSDLVPDETWRMEKWYGALSRATRLSPEQMKAWEFPVEFDSRLHMPALNAYIPTDFSLRCDDDSERKNLDLVKEEELAIRPEILIDNPRLRLWHKMDRFWRIPKTSVRLSILSNFAYSSPRAITYNRIFQRVLNDDLNSFVYDAAMAGCNYRVSCIPSGYRISVRGFSEKLPFLLQTLTSRILSILDDMKAGDPVLRGKFNKARQSLLQETKNFRLDPPNEVANYNTRLVMEEKAYYLDDYVDEMEGPVAERLPLTMEECSDYVKQGILGKTKIEALCMGNIDKAGVMQVADLIRSRFLEKGRPLSEVEMPDFRSIRLPTPSEAAAVFGSANRSIPLVHADLAQSPSEENNAAEVVLQVGSELDLGYEGMAIFDLICHIAYGSAYNQLRTNEQLGYIVSAYARKTVGNAWGMSVLVQGGVALPEEIEERVEAWLSKFRQELEAMSPAAIAAEAQAVVAQLLEVESRLSQEVNRYWGEILNTEGLTSYLRTPSFDRLERLAECLDMDEEDEAVSSELKTKILNFFDKHLSASSPDRRVMSGRVYSQRNRQFYETAKTQPGVLSSFADITYAKRFLSTHSTVPYWRVDDFAVTKPLLSAEAETTTPSSVFLVSTSPVRQAPSISPATGCQNQFYTWREGQVIRYQTAGPESGEPLLLVHGLFVNSDHWRKTIPFMASQGYRVFAIDLFGCGYSDKPDRDSEVAQRCNGENGRFDKRSSPPVLVGVELGTADGKETRTCDVDLRHPLGSPYNFFTWSELLTDFSKDVILAKDKEHNKVTLVCNSIGTISSLQAVLDSPDLYRGVFVVSPNFRELHSAEVPFSALSMPILRRVQSALRQYGQAAFDFLAKPDYVKQILMEPYAVTDAVDDTLVEVLLDPLLTAGASQVVFDTLSYSAGPLPEQQLQALSEKSLSRPIPVWVCYGDADPWTPGPRVEALTRYKAVEHVERLPDVGHCPHDEAPELVNPLLLKFLERLRNEDA